LAWSTNEVIDLHLVGKTLKAAIGCNWLIEASAELAFRYFLQT